MTRTERAVSIAVRSQRCDDVDCVSVEAEKKPAIRGEANPQRRPAS